MSSKLSLSEDDKNTIRELLNDLSDKIKKKIRTVTSSHNIHRRFEQKIYHKIKLLIINEIDKCADHIFSYYDIRSKIEEKINNLDEIIAEHCMSD